MTADMLARLHRHDCHYLTRRRFAHAGGNTAAASGGYAAAALPRLRQCCCPVPCSAARTHAPKRHVGRRLSRTTMADGW